MSTSNGACTELVWVVTWACTLPKCMLSGRLSDWGDEGGGPWLSSRDQPQAEPHADDPAPLPHEIDPRFHFHSPTSPRQSKGGLVGGQRVHVKGVSTVSPPHTFFFFFSK